MTAATATAVAPAGLRRPRKLRTAEFWPTPADRRRPGRPLGIGYARLSKDPEGKLVAVADQIAASLADAEARDLDLEGVFYDDDLSAWREDVIRPSWDAYLAALASGRYAFAESYHSDRLARNGRDGEAFLSVMTKAELPLYTPGATLDIGGSGDARFMARIQFAVAIQSSDSTSRRLRDRKDAARRRGSFRYVLGSTPPLGLRNGADDWEGDPDAGAFLAGIASAVLADSERNLSAAYRSAVEARDPAEPPVDGSGRPASEKMVRAALQRPATAGLMTDRSGEVVGDPGVSLLASAPLDPVTFWRLHDEVFATRKLGRREDPDRYPFGPILRCGKCHNQLTGETRETKAGEVLYYRCANPHKELGITKPCRGVSVEAAPLEAVLRDAVETWAAESPDYAEAYGRTANVGDQKAALETALADRRDRFAESVELWEAGDLPDAAYRRIAERFAAFKATTVRELTALAEVARKPLPAPDLDWDGMTVAQRVSMTEEAFGTVEVAPSSRRGPRKAGVSAEAEVEARLSLVPVSRAA